MTAFSMQTQQGSRASLGTSVRHGILSLASMSFRAATQVGSTSTAGGNPPGPWKQLQMLAVRAFRQQARDAYVNVSRAVANVLIGVALGTVNFKLGRSQKSIQSRAALLVQVPLPVHSLVTSREHILRH
jgi:hypothetical protein